MEKIIIHKQTTGSIRKDGVMIRISKEVSQQLESLSEETGLSKTRVADYLLKKALAVVEVVENEI